MTFQGEDLSLPTECWRPETLGVLEPFTQPPRHVHGDLTSLAPHERLPEFLVVPRAEIFQQRGGAVKALTPTTRPSSDRQVGEL